MSFSSEVKEELGKRLDTARHCQIAEFAAIMAFCGKMRSDSGEEMEIEVMTENEVVLRKFILLAESIFEMEEHDFVIEHEGKKNSLIHVYIKEPVYVTKILMTLKWCDEQFTQIEPVFVHPILVQKECCKKHLSAGRILRRVQSATLTNFIIMKLSVNTKKMRCSYRNYCCILSWMPR